MKPLFVNHQGRKLIFRNMTRAELENACAWAGEEGWNPGIHDADAFWAADPDGYFMAELDGEFAGCVSAVAYDERFGFMGFYIVRRDLRAQGIGIQLFHLARQYMGERNVGGDGVIERLDDYRKEGLIEAHRNSRFEGVGEAFEVHGTIPPIPLSEIPFAQLEAFDRQMFPAPRAAFLKHWIVQPEGAALGIVEDGALQGYGVIRKCLKGFKLAPLFARTPRCAERLFRALGSVAAGQPLYLDVPLANEAAVELARTHGMTPVFATGRIYSKGAPALPLEQIFGITSFELG